MKVQSVNFLRYPGGKQRMLHHLKLYLPARSLIKGKYIEPFVGGGAVFFAIQPQQAILSDVNSELIELYRGIQECPEEVWHLFQAFPSTKEAYYEIRGSNILESNLASRAARTLYLSRTCFKGMWRHNERGQFNVGYGGQDRRWVITKETIVGASEQLQYANLLVSDFETVIDTALESDFLFIDPPYRPGACEILREHYAYCQFSYDDHKRLARVLERASRRGVQWAMTTSSHPNIVSLFREHRVLSLPKGTGKKPGVIT